jgi:predicted lysophospholipase L1 biosynthesis ABC-type transport system permease subunit
MRAHLHLLGILQLVWGAIGLLLGVSMLLLAMGALAIGVTSGTDRMAAGITAGAFLTFAIVLLAGGGANVWAGRALRRNRPHGRLAVLWLGALNLFILPFGTAL